MALLVSALAHVLFSATAPRGTANRTRAVVPVHTAALAARLLPPAPIDTPALSDLPAPSIAAQEKRPASPATISVGPRPGDAPATTERAVSPGDGGIDARDGTYYGARELDVYPALTAGLPFLEPRETSRSERAQRIVLLLHIGANGMVDAVKVVEAHPSGPFEEEARRAFESAQFRPARKNGRPVRSRILVELDYGRPPTALP